jgi:membrane protease YdiL (CAAX protease family)
MPRGGGKLIGHNSGDEAMTQPPFWQPATHRAQLWRTMLGFVLIMAFWLASSFAMVLLGARLLGTPAALVAQGNTWATAAVFFASFLGFHLGLAVVLPILHRRGYGSLFGPGGLLNLRHFGLGAGVMLGLAGALYALMAVEHLVLPDGVAPPLRQAGPALPWLAGLLPALALILLQVSAEEALFRGYLLQQLRARFRSALVWGAAPSLVFGLLHFQPAIYGMANALAYVLNATVIGTFAAFITLRTGNLGAAVGLHFGNNAALTVIGVSGSLEGFSLFLADVPPASGYMTYSILAQTAVTTLVFLAWWRWMNRHRPIANSGPSS